MFTEARGGSLLYFVLLVIKPRCVHVNIYVFACVYTYMYVCVCVHVNVCDIHAHTCAWKQRPEVNLGYYSTGAIYLGLGFGFVPFCYVLAFVFCSEAGCIARPG